MANRKRYTEADVEKTLNRYFKRVERVMEVLGMQPLTENNIGHVVDVSQDFQIVYEVQQSRRGGARLSVHEPKIAVCRERILKQNPKMRKDEPLLHVFAGIPLDIETSPFFFVAYDDPTFGYVVENAATEQESPKLRTMRTRKGVQFYLAKEEDVDDVLSVRPKLG